MSSDIEANDPEYMKKMKKKRMMRKYGIQYFPITITINKDEQNPENNKDVTIEVRICAKKR